jgi:tetratricopeptide (TPR) repeat protein
VGLVSAAPVSTFDGAAFLKLPRHCQAFYAGAVRSGQIKGVIVDLSQYEMNLRATLGSASAYLNRYCPALVSLMRETRRDQTTDTDRPGRKRALGDILTGFDDQLKKTQWNASNLWFKSEVLTNMGRVFQLLGEQEKATEAFHNAIETYPAYVAAHWELARLHEANNDIQAAVSVLQKAKQVRLSRAARKRVEDKIGELEASAEAE